MESGMDSQEQQDHQAGEAGGDQGFPLHALDGGAHENRLVGERHHFQLRGNRGENAGQGLLYRFDDGQGRGLAVPGDGQQNAAGPVHANDVVLHVEAVADLRHVPDVHRGAIHRFDGQVVQVVHPDRAAVDPDQVLGPGQLGRARRQNQVLLGQRVRDIDRRELFGVELIRVQVHHHRPRFSAEWVRNRGALHGAERGADEVVAQVE
jgi:hypothetical protein